MKCDKCYLGDVQYPCSRYLICNEKAIFGNRIGVVDPDYTSGGFYRSNGMSNNRIVYDTENKCKDCKYYDTLNCKLNTLCTNYSAFEPAHMKQSIDVMDVIKEYTDGLVGIEAVAIANIIDCACNWKNDQSIDNIEKIMFYLNSLITHVGEKKYGCK